MPGSKKRDRTLTSATQQCGTTICWTWVLVVVGFILVVQEIMFAYTVRGRKYVTSTVCIKDGDQIQDIGSMPE